MEKIHETWTSFCLWAKDGPHACPLRYDYYYSILKRNDPLDSRQLWWCYTLLERTGRNSKTTFSRKFKSPVTRRRL